MEIVSRSGWGARKPKTTPQQVSPALREYFVVHHSAGPASQTVRQIQDWCMNEPPRGRGFNDLDYNFMIDQQGQVYEGRGWDVIGAHTTGYNTAGIGVCLIGRDQISPAAKAALVKLYHAANGRCGRTLKIRGHRQLASTACPGDRVYAWLRSGMPLPHPPEKEPDMDWDDDVIPNPAWREDAKTNKAVKASFAIYDAWNQAHMAMVKAAAADQKLNQVLVLLKDLTGRDFTDEPAIVAGLLAGLTPEVIAAAIPSDLAQRVVDELAARMEA